jgi:hypothetical protein
MMTGMGTERHGTARSGADLRERQQELLRSLRAAVDTLNLCVDRIEALISRVDGQEGAPAEPPVTRPPAQISYGGGASLIGSREPGSLNGERESATGARRWSSPGTLGFRDSLLGSADRRRAERKERQIAFEEHRAGLGEPDESRTPGTPALMMATELAHLGYSRKEIGERLTERWGESAAAILRAALD